MTTNRVALRAGPRAVTVSSPDKELFGPGGVTKRELAHYYLEAAPALLRHLRGRPLAVQRYPHGIATGGGFYVKHPPPTTPDWVGTVEVPRRHGGTSTMFTCEDPATLVWLADQAAFPFHSWLARADQPHRPDRLVIDIDPARADTDFAAVRAAAWDTRAVLRRLGLACYLMTTGSRGLHVLAPLRRELDPDDARRFARIVAEVVAGQRPAERTTRLRKELRGGRMFIDYLRNGYAQLTVAPYSVRALPGAPVAMPLCWDELDTLTSARAWTVGALGDRAGADPWADMPRHARSPRRAIERLERVTDPG